MKLVHAPTMMTVLWLISGCVKDDASDDEAGAARPGAEVGTEADFEEEAETTLNTDDIAGELDKIEKAIGQ